MIRRVKVQTSFVDRPLRIWEWSLLGKVPFFVLQCHIPNGLLGLQDDDLVSI